MDRSFHVEPIQWPGRELATQIVFEKIPEKREKRAYKALLVTSLVVGLGIIIYVVMAGRVHHYKPADEYFNITGEKVIVCTKVKSYIYFKNLSFGLLAILLGTVVKRSYLLVEELYHFESRYNKDVPKIIKACFSGMGKLTMILVFILLGTVIVIISLDDDEFKDIYIIYLISGIGITPLFVILLKFDKQSTIEISKTIDEKETNIGEILAWSYYYDELNSDLSELVTHYPDTKCDAKLDIEQEVLLSSNQLILLVSSDCSSIVNLGEQDDTISRLGEISHRKSTFPVYRFTYEDTEYTYIIKYIMKPLENIQRMSLSRQTEAVQETECEHQVKLFYRTLSTRILVHPPNLKFRNRCICVPIIPERLDNGGLVKLIMRKIQAGTEDGFMRIVPGIRNFSQTGSGYLSNI